MGQAHVGSSSPTGAPEEPANRETGAGDGGPCGQGRGASPIESGTGKLLVQGTGLPDVIHGDSGSGGNSGTAQPAQGERETPTGIQATVQLERSEILEPSKGVGQVIDEAQEALRYVQFTGETKFFPKVSVTMYWSAYYRNWCTWESIWNVYCQHGRANV